MKNGRENNVRGEVTLFREGLEGEVSGRLGRRSSPSVIYAAVPK